MIQRQLDKLNQLVNAIEESVYICEEDNWFEPRIADMLVLTGVQELIAVNGASAFVVTVDCDKMEIVEWHSFW